MGMIRKKHDYVYGKGEYKVYTDYYMRIYIHIYNDKYIYIRQNNV